jgi:hypothetical protein
MSTAVLMSLLLLAGEGTPTDQARTLTRRSIIDFDTGAYAKALEEIEHAYELAPRPELLFNVAQCHRALGHHREAALAYKSYLRALPNARNRAIVEGLLAQMIDLARQDETAKKPEPSSTPVLVLSAAPAAVEPPAPSAPAIVPAPVAAVTASEGKGHIRAGAWWLGGGGLAVAIVGGVLFGVAESTLGGDHTVKMNGVVEHSLPVSTVQTATTEGNVGEVLWAVGGALLVGGVIVAATGGSP